MALLKRDQALKAMKIIDGSRGGLWLGLLFSLLVTGCSDNGFPLYASLDGLRILALKIDQPEITYNAGVDSYAVALTPLISDFGGSGNVEITLQACLDPGVVVGVQADCSEAAVASSVTTLIVTPAVGAAADIFGEGTRTGIPSSGPVNLTVPFPRTLWSKFSSAVQFNGVPCVVVVKAKTSDGVQQTTAFRRVLISSKNTPNANPVISDLKANGNSLGALPSGQTSLTFDLGASAETYSFQKSSGETLSLNETLELSWFTTDGEIKFSRSRSGERTNWTPPSSAPAGGRKVILVGVLRDGRGGVDYMVRAL